jgi:Family of unknown function (DUF5677)
MKTQMNNLFSAFQAKLYHWIQFTKFCFSERGAQLTEARQLTKLGMSVLSRLDYSTRSDLTIEHFEPFVAHIFGIYYAAVGHHDAIQSLALSGHSLDTFILLRSQLETILTFFYVTEPQTDLTEVCKRTDSYRDWVMVKMKQNLEKSQKFELLRAVQSKNFDDTVYGNYDALKEKYSRSPGQFAKLEKMNNYLNRSQREEIATKFGMEGLYHHVYAESSASIHSADISDRMRPIGPSRYRYTIRYKHGAFWPLAISNLMQRNCIAQFGKFFGIESNLMPSLKDIFVPNK